MDLGEFNGPFLGWLLAFGLVALIFIFYFNRLIAFVLFSIIRAYTWIFYRVHVKCQAFQCSLLGGRIFLRGLSYHGENETILVHQVYITWQYWYRRVAHVDVSPAKQEQGGGDSSSELSGEQPDVRHGDSEAASTVPRHDAKCRISAHVRGVEWFVYNRSPAYDGILASAARTVFTQNQEREGGSDFDGKAPNLNENDVSDGSKLARTLSADRGQHSGVVGKTNPEPPFFLKLLPVFVDCNKAAMVMGNQHTRSVLVAKVDSAKGRITANASGPSDIFRQAFEFNASSLTVKFVPNEDYIEPLLAAGARLNGVADDPPDTQESKHTHNRRIKPRHRARHAFGKLIPQFRRSVESFERRSGSLRRGDSTVLPDSGITGIPRWIGLTRYLDEEEEDRLEHDRWQGIEYAQSQTVADFSSIFMNFYWDTPGYVGAVERLTKTDLSAASAGDINGSSPPEWSLELRLGEGKVQYGPWADRQRVDFMTVFFPAAYMDAVPGLPLRDGQLRISTVFKILIILDGKVEMSILTREASKDWKFKGLAQNDVETGRGRVGNKQSRNGKQPKLSFDPHDRPAAWVNISVAANTTVTYDMDMIPRKVGFTNTLNVDVVAPEITSSVNQDVLFKSTSMNVSADISNPLGWNALHAWRFDITSKDADLFMLREHAFLIQDLVEDFTLGPPPAFYTFVPFTYDLRLNFDRLRVYLNANEINIIDNPTDLNENTLLVLEPGFLSAKVGIPANQLKPLQNKIDFAGELLDTKFRVLTPSWNTYNSLLEKRPIGTFPRIAANGCYNYFTESSTANTDTLLMDIHGDNPEMYLYGFLIKYFLNFQENYFGKDVHFQTLEEYQGRIDKPGRRHADDNEHKPTKQSSDLDVILSITTKNPSILLPSTLYTNTSCVKLDLEDGHADLRFTNYYMDLQTWLSPVSVSHHLPNAETREHRSPEDVGVQTFIDGVTITGHRLFGLPPAEPTYACNWDFAVGDITGESSVQFLSSLVAGIQAFIYGLDDDENALPGHEEESLNDVTFLRASINPIRLWLLVDQVAFLCQLSSSRVEFNDWSRRRFSDGLFLSIPDIVLAVVDRASASRSQAKQTKAITYGYLQTSVDFRMVQSKANLRESRKNQQEHLRFHDARTNRTPWLVRDAALLASSRQEPALAKLQPPASQYPPIPNPVGGNEGGDLEVHQSRSGRPSSLKRKPSSFLLRTDSYTKSPTGGAERKRSRTPRSSTQAKDCATASRGVPKYRIPRQETGAALTSSYARPHFSFHGVEPSANDVPVIHLQNPAGRLRSDSYLDADDIPLDDDTIVHVSFMINLETGFRIMCAPPALEGTNRLLATVMSCEPTFLLDSLQISSLNGVVAARKPDKVPKSVQIRLDLPGLALRLRHQNVERIDLSTTRQHYEVALQNLTVFARLGAERPMPLGKTPTSVHVSLSQLEIEASRSMAEAIYDAQVIGKLTDLSFWVHEAEEIATELQFRSLEFASLNRRTEHLAALVNEAGTLADQLLNAFRSTLLTHTARLQFLVYHLTSTGQHVADPPLLGTAAFISRSSIDHVRASDSWKMLMRLRWILKSMDLPAIQRLSQLCAKATIDMPSDARTQVVSGFEQWRGWDFTHAESCSFMRELYGKAAPVDRAMKTPPKPIRAAFVSEKILLTIDPLQKGNRIVSSGLSLGVESTVDFYESDTHRIGTNLFPSRRTSAQMFCDNLLLEVKLDLLDAVRGIFSHVKNIEASQQPPQPALPGSIAKDFIKHEIHAIMLIKQSSLRLRTRNLKSTLSGDDFSSSILVRQSSRTDTRVGALINARQLSVDSNSHSRALLRITVATPVLHVDLIQTKRPSRIDNRWSLGAYCPRITIDVLENVLGLLAVADQMVNDEMIFLQEFLNDMKKAGSLTSPAPSDTPANNSVRVTLELGSYRVTTVIFSSLRYRLDGRGARSTVTPLSTGGALSYQIDVDVREHSHGVFTQDGDTIWEVAKLAMPPIEVKAGVDKTDSVLAIGVNVHLSVIKIDAASVHGLFSALSRRELMHFAEDVKRDVGIVQSNYETVTSAFDDHESVAQETLNGDKTVDMCYFARIGIDGVSVLAQSSKSLKTSAELIIDSGPIGFAINNKDKDTDSIVAIPNIDLHLNAIKITLESLQDGIRSPCGKITLAFSVVGRSEMSEGRLTPAYAAIVDRLGVDIYTETASMIIDILGYLQQRFKRFNLKEEIQTLRAKRRRRRTISRAKANEDGKVEIQADDDVAVALFDAIITFQLRELQVAWRVSSMEVMTPIAEPEDLVFSIEVVDLRTKRGNTARLEIKNLLLQLVPQSDMASTRSKNSALLPEVVFKVAHRSTNKDRRLAFQALGKALDLRLTSQFILPVSNLQKSIAIATTDLRNVLADWNETLIENDSERKSFLSNKKLTSLVVDADFDGAVVSMEGRDPSERMRNRTNRMSRHGRLGQYEDRNNTTLRSPGLAFKVEYKDTEPQGRLLGAEIKVAASENQLKPMFVPLVLEVVSSVKDLVGNAPQQVLEAEPAEESSVQKTEIAPDPTAILGDCKLNLGVRICAQSFSLTCEPIAKVTATAKFDDIYISVSTVQPEEGERFFAVSSAITGLETSVKHVFSREPTGRFQVKSIDLSMMNSEHVSGMKGISSILNISPMTVLLNVKQLQDFLTFREIWYPVEIRPVPQAPTPSTDKTIGGVERYYQATAANSFSWNAAIKISSLELQLDLGQSVGRLTFYISSLWVTSRKESAQEQNLCLGFDSIGIESKGRMSGSIELRNLRLRTNIMWQDKPSLRRTPLVQASLTFGDLRARAAFDYQTFAVADFQSLGFLLYNTSHGGEDRLICTVNGDKIHAYCTANVAAQSVALYQAVDKLIQEKLTAFEITLRQMEKFQRQKAAAGLGLSVSQELPARNDGDADLAPVRLQVNVVVSLNALKIGIYPRALTDNQIFKLEALDALARFGVNIQDGQTHTLLTVVLGQLRVALSSISRDQRPKALTEVSIEDVVKDSVNSRGGTILKVPRVVATMMTWQPLHTKHVEYIFRSTFEGKVEVGWNYARISYLRTMWETHSKALEQRLGKPLSQSAVQITRSPRPDMEKFEEKDEDGAGPKEGPKELITAVVNVPLSKYTYHAREPPVIQTPQLRDMGEATPPLEWIGLQRDKLPNLTHQVIIVPLLEFAKEVEDAYGKILGAK